MSPPKQNGWRYVQWARTQEVGDASAKAVLNALATYADWTTGSCTVGQETLARHTEKGVSTVRAALARLEASGFIQRKARGEQGRRLADEIRLTPRTDNPLAPDVSGSEPSTTARFQRTTASFRPSLPPASGGVTLQSEHAMLNTPREGASLQVSGGRPSVLANLPSGEQVRTASELLREYNLYGNGGPTIEALWLGFAEHAQRTGRQIKNEDGAWVAWVIKAIDLERAKLGKPPSASRIAGIRRNA